MGERDNYYGFGNQTPTRQSAFTEADLQALEVFPSLVAYQNPRRTFSLALSPEIKFARNRADSERDGPPPARTRGAVAPAEGA